MQCRSKQRNKFKNSFVTNFVIVHKNWHTDCTETYVWSYFEWLYIYSLNHYVNNFAGPVESCRSTWGEEQGSFEINVMNSYVVSIHPIQFPWVKDLNLCFRTRCLRLNTWKRTTWYIFLNSIFSVHKSIRCWIS